VALRRQRQMCIRDRPPPRGRKLDRRLPRKRLRHLHQTHLHHGRRPNICGRWRSSHQGNHQALKTVRKAGYSLVGIIQQGTLGTRSTESGEDGIGEDEGDGLG
jgi:hypothetical protein